MTSKVDKPEIIAELQRVAEMLGKDQLSQSDYQGNRTRFATKARDYIVTMFKALRTSSR
jgi:hypothetical protein